MFKDKKISLKLKTFLLATIVESEILASTDSTLVELMATKLEQLNILAASHIAIGLRKYYRIYSNIKPEEDITTSFGSTTPGKYMENAPTASNEIDGNPYDVEEAEGIKTSSFYRKKLYRRGSYFYFYCLHCSHFTEKAPTILSNKTYKAEEGTLSFMQRLRMKRLAEEAAIVQAHNSILETPTQEKQENDDAPSNTIQNKRTFRVANNGVLFPHIKAAFIRRLQDSGLLYSTNALS